MTRKNKRSWRIEKNHQTIRNAYELKDNNIKEFSKFQEKYLKDLNKKNEKLEGMIKGRNSDKNNIIVIVLKYFIIFF